MEGISLKKFKKSTKEFSREISGIEKKLSAVENLTGKTKLMPLPHDLENSTKLALQHLKEQKQKLEQEMEK